MCFSLDNRRLACFLLAGRFLGRELKVKVQTVSIRELSPFQLRKCRTAAQSMLTVGGRFVHLRRRTKVFGKTVRTGRHKITHCTCLVTCNIAMILCALSILEHVGGTQPKKKENNKCIITIVSAQSYAINIYDECWRCTFMCISAFIVHIIH